MCGVFLSTDYQHLCNLVNLQAHRGRDGMRVTTIPGKHKVWLGFRRLAIRDSIAQPFETKTGFTCFNGEIFNNERLWAMIPARDRVGVGRSEPVVLDYVMHRYRQDFERFLDGYYGIIRVDTGRQHIIATRDWPGVMPLYYQKYGVTASGRERPFAIASEKKGLEKPIEVQPGETLTFSYTGKLLRRRRYNPVSLQNQPFHLTHLEFLFDHAVSRRIAHSDVPVCVALSGGLDSALVLGCARYYHPKIEAVTVIASKNSDEERGAVQLCTDWNVKQTLVYVTPELLAEHMPRIRYHLEDQHQRGDDKAFGRTSDNPIKMRGMIRNYFTAMYAPGKVILCGEGADEIGCGYPPLVAAEGLDRIWKSYQAVRSMHAINLDRVNKGGMAHTREFRAPFLDRSLLLYMLSCEKGANKQWLRDLGHHYQVPPYIWMKPKYGIEEATLSQMARTI